MASRLAWGCPVSDLQTIATLVQVARSAPTCRELCCPTCGGEALLDETLLWCQRGAHVFERLAELAVKP